LDSCFPVDSVFGTISWESFFGAVGPFLWGSVDIGKDGF